MTSVLFSVRSSAVLFAFAALTPASASAAPADLSYVRCPNGGGDYRISELNHSITQFSEREQRYRLICSDCDIIEWGNRIVMKNANKTFIQFDRVSGEVSVQKPGSAIIPGFSYRGNCSKSTVVVARATRVF